VEFLQDIARPPRLSESNGGQAFQKQAYLL
jgi:hypothetical protein